jgi:hypothetical protein
MIGHEADLDSLVWDAQKVKKIPKPKPKSKPTTPKEDEPFKPSGTSQGRVAKRPDVGRAKVEGVRLSSREKPAPKPVTPALASDGKYDDRRIVDERFADYYNDHRREKEWDHEDEMTYDYRSNEHFGRTYQEEHFRKYNAGERSGKLLVDRDMSNNPAGRSPRCPFPVAAGMNSTTPISGLTSDELKLIQGESFDDILSSMIRLKKDKVQKAQQIQKRTASELAEKPITDFENHLVAACDQYNGMFPKNPDEVDLRSAGPDGEIDTEDDVFPDE